MNSKVYALAFITFAGDLIAKLVLLFSQSGVKNFSDISQVTYTVALLTALGTAIVVFKAALVDPSSPATDVQPPKSQGGFARAGYLIGLAAAVTLALSIAALPGCIAPALAQNDQDMIAQGYAAVEDIGHTVADAQKIHSVSDSDAKNIKVALQEAHDLLDSAKAAPAGSDNRLQQLTRAQNILALIRQQIVAQGAAK